MKRQWEAKDMTYQRIIAAFVISLALSAGALAQQSRVQPQGRLVGQLRDLCGAGITKAIVKITGARFKRKIKSDREGRFELYLPTGIYEITVEKYGFKRYIVPDVQVRSESEAAVKLDMEAGYASDDPNGQKPSSAPCPPPNNGMHPTADTLPVIYFQRCGAAGDAGRYTAFDYEVQRPQIRRA